MHSIAHPPEVLKRGPATLRRWQFGDEEALYVAVIESQDHLRPWMPWAPGYSRQSAFEFVVACDRDWDTGAAFNYAITVDGAIAGSCGKNRRRGLRHR